MRTAKEPFDKDILINNKKTKFIFKVLDDPSLARKQEGKKGTKCLILGGREKPERIP